MQCLTFADVMWFGPDFKPVPGMEGRLAPYRVIHEAVWLQWAHWPAGAAHLCLIGNLRALPRRGVV